MEQATTQLTQVSAAKLATELQAGNVSPLDVVDAHIARIQQVNPTINALMAERFAAARVEAQQAAALPPSQRGPLHGLPITIKAAIDVAGMPASCGLTSRANHIPAVDATVVARLRAAGAIVLASTSTPDNCWSQETINPLSGRTNNPWNPARTTGGSTGGEAAIIAAGGSALGVGSDIAGSIRLPAAFCGIVGLRPTSGALPEEGFWPPSQGVLGLLNALGPMARRVEDVALAWDVLRGVPPVKRDPATIRGLRVAHGFDDGVIPISAAIRGGVQAALWALEQAGMQPVSGEPTARRLAMLGWGSIGGEAERTAVATGFGGGEVWNPAIELLRALAGRGRVSGPALASWLATHYSIDLNKLLQIDAMAWRERIRRQMHELLGNDGVFVCPVFPTTAPFHGYSYIALFTSINYQVWVNLGGLPGLSLPVGFSGNGMPVGVQLIGAPGGEETLLAAGMAIQQALMPEWIGPNLAR